MSILFHHFKELTQCILEVEQMKNKEGDDEEE
jgi:hypothetical protein